MFNCSKKLKGCILDTAKQQSIVKQIEEVDYLEKLYLKSQDK